MDVKTRENQWKLGRLHLLINIMWYNRKFHNSCLNGPWDEMSNREEINVRVHTLWSSYTTLFLNLFGTQTPTFSKSWIKHNKICNTSHRTSALYTWVNKQKVNGSQKQHSLHTNMAALCIYHLKCKSLCLYSVQKSFYSPAHSVVTLPPSLSPPFLFVSPTFSPSLLLLFLWCWA